MLTDLIEASDITVGIGATVSTNQVHFISSSKSFDDIVRLLAEGLRYVILDTIKCNPTVSPELLRQRIQLILNDVIVKTLQDKMPDPFELLTFGWKPDEEEKH